MNDTLKEFFEFLNENNPPKVSTLKYKLEKIGIDDTNLNDKHNVLKDFITTLFVCGKPFMGFALEDEKDERKAKYNAKIGYYKEKFLKLLDTEKNDTIKKIYLTILENI